MSISLQLGTTAEQKPRMDLRETGREHDASGIELLRHIAHRISEAAPLEDVLGEVVESVAAIVRCDSCFIYVLEGAELVLRASKNPHAEVVDRLKLGLGQGITGWVAEHREPAVITGRAGSDPRFKLFNELPEDRFEAFLSVPIVSRGRLVGVINVQNRDPYHYDEREVGLVSTIGFLVGAEIEMARLEEQNVELLQRLESRTLVERAKGILQDDLGLTESEAYQRLQRQSQQLRKPMKEIAEAIVLSHLVRRGAPGS
jgi:signal transduction protein with GAF and PtsI domain